MTDKKKKMIPSLPLSDIKNVNFKKDESQERWYLLGEKNDKFNFAHIELEAKGRPTVQCLMSRRHDPGVSRY